MGLRFLLEYARQRWCLLLACDMPLLRPKILKHLFAAAIPECDAVAFGRPDQPNTWHACCALYHPRILSVALLELRQGGRSLQKLLASVRLIAIDPCPEEQRMLVNLNTPQDYERLGHHA
jgi:molybdopterin-guanine dinucleotide biosynthesis protein A